jgi:hypothetical protein
LKSAEFDLRLAGIRNNSPFPSFDKLGMDRPALKPEPIGTDHFERTWRVLISPSLFSEKMDGSASPEVKPAYPVRYT